MKKLKKKNLLWVLYASYFIICLLIYIKSKQVFYVFSKIKNPLNFLLKRSKVSYSLASLEKERLDLEEIAKHFNESFAIQNILKYQHTYDSLPFIFLVTPTYARCTQLADLTRLRNTLLHVPKLIWIVIEDSANKTNVISKFLNESRLSFIHLYQETTLKKKPDKSSWSRHKGILQRNKAIDWLRNSSYQDGVVYFADDDNVYDLRLFDEVYRI